VVFFLEQEDLTSCKAGMGDAIYQPLERFK